MENYIDKKAYFRKNEKFISNKRKIIRESEQLAKKFDCDVYLFIHHKPMNNVHEFKTDPTFDLEKVSRLVAEYILNKRNRVQKK